jgi:hypothetical protein
LTAAKELTLRDINWPVTAIMHLDCVTLGGKLRRAVKVRSMRPNIRERSNVVLHTGEGT